MKKSGLNIIAVLFIVLLVAGCKKDYITEVIPPAYSKFATNKKTADFNVINSPSSEYKIPIGITNISNEARVIQLKYTSSTGAAQGVQYNGPESITIPAGKSVDTLRIKGIFTGYDVPGREDKLTVQILDGTIPVLQSDSVILTMQKACAINEAALPGLYTKSQDKYGVYTTAVTNIVKPTPDATTAQADIVNVYNYGWSDLKVVFDWTDPANFMVTVPNQSVGGGYTVVSTPGKPGTFSSCNNTIKLFLDISNPTTGDFANGFVVFISN